MPGDLSVTPLRISPSLLTLSSVSSIQAEEAGSTVCSELRYWCSELSCSVRMGSDGKGHFWHSTLVIGISSEPCCTHFVALFSEESTEELLGEPMGTLMCLWNRKDTESNGASDWPLLDSVSFKVSASHCQRLHVNHVRFLRAWECVTISVPSLNPWERVSSVQFKTNLVSPIRVWMYGKRDGPQECDSPSVMHFHLCFGVELIMCLWKICKAHRIKVTRR